MSRSHPQRDYGKISLSTGKYRQVQPPVREQVSRGMRGVCSFGYVPWISRPVAQASGLMAMVMRATRGFARKPASADASSDSWLVSCAPRSLALAGVSVCTGRPPMGANRSHFTLARARRQTIALRRSPNRCAPPVRAAVSRLPASVIPRRAADGRIPCERMRRS